MKNYSLITKLLSIFLIWSFSSHSIATEPGCLRENLAYQTIFFKDGDLTFKYSSDCAPRGRVLRRSRHPHPGKFYLETYWPGFISHKEIAGEKSNEYIKLHLELSYGPTPLMVSSIVERFNNEEKYDFIEKIGEYNSYHRKSAPTKQPPSSQRSIHISHPERQDFFIDCYENICTIEGITGNVLYRLDVYTKEPMDWLQLHETTVVFINQSLVKKK